MVTWRTGGASHEGGLELGKGGYRVIVTTKAGGVSWLEMVASGPKDIVGSNDSNGGSG